jgi:hypothetical protein
LCRPKVTSNVPAAPEEPSTLNVSTFTWQVCVPVAPAACVVVGAWEVEAAVELEEDEVLGERREDLEEAVEQDTRPNPQRKHTDSTADALACTRCEPGLRS